MESYRRISVIIHVTMTDKPVVDFNDQSRQPARLIRDVKPK